MKVGDLVMWTGKDEWHGMIGVITEVLQDRSSVTKWYNVQWSDGVFGKELHHLEIMAVEDEERQQS